MEIALFAIVAVVVYVISDRVVRAIEAHRGDTLQNRQIVFFIIFFGLILASFEVLKLFLASGN